MKTMSLITVLFLSIAGYAQPGNVCSQGNYKMSFIQKLKCDLIGSGNYSATIPKDPNEIKGPEGYDSVRWVSINDMLNYTVLFENDPEFATAAAQKVDIRFNFPNKALMKGFGIGGYCFSNMSFPIAKPSNAYQQRIDLKDTLGFYVDLIGGLDVAKLQGFWTFSSIDPETGYAPWQAEKGMLPVNDSTHVGEGFVTFQLQPFSTMKTGDSISIVANIVFDENDTIATNRWCNKIDAGMPESKVTAEPHPTLPSVYNLKFTGKDDIGGSGLKHLLLYQANHNGIYEEVDTVTVDSVLAFPVEAGKQYKLYSIAVDNTGNREPAKAEPDVILNFNQAPTDIALSDSTFQDDLEAGGFIGKLTAVDSEDEKTFTYALAEGEGAVHNDLFQITDDRLEIKNSFKCADGDRFNVRISTTDDGGLSYSKAFKLNLEKVLVKPKADTLKVEICEGETCMFHGIEYGQTGNYVFSQSNDYMCDSVYVLLLSVHQPLEAPLVTVEGTSTLVSSAQKGNQWFHEDGTLIEGATNQKFTPTEDGTYYVAASNGSCYSAPSQLYQVRLSDDMNLQLNLKTGWNWVSSNLSEATNQNAKQFLKPIEDITERFVGQTDELINDPVYGLTGGLTTLVPTESYRLKVSGNGNHTWSGSGSKPENTVMNLRKGWNWIGYVPVMGNGLSAALAGVTPSENDVIKYMDDFATYSDGNWVGTLTELKPGEGYLYYAGNDKTFYYPAQRVFPIANNSRMMATLGVASPWNYNVHQYPDNTTIIAKLLVDDLPAIEGAFAVGAFVEGSKSHQAECRGIGKLVDGKLFITVHGTISEKQRVHFKAYEYATGQEMDIDESIRFEGQMLGNAKTPFLLHTKSTTKVESTKTDKYAVYPRPLRNRMFVNGETEIIESVKVLATDGSIKLQQEGYPTEGIDVSHLSEGIYLIAIVLNNGKVYYEKVFKD